MFQLDGKVCVGPGVEEAAVCDAVGVAAAVVVVGVGVDVAVGVAGCVHPAASTRTVQSTSAAVIIRIFFIREFCPGGYMRIVSGEIGYHFTACMTGSSPLKKEKSSETYDYARFPDAGSIPVGWFLIVRSFMIV